MKVPKCPKTVTGKHTWKKINLYYDGEKWHSFEIKPVCIYCGLIDDRKKVKTYEI